MSLSVWPWESIVAFLAVLVSAAGYRLTRQTHKRQVSLERQAEAIEHAAEVIEGYERFCTRQSNEIARLERKIDAKEREIDSLRKQLDDLELAWQGKIDELRSEWHDELERRTAMRIEYERRINRLETEKEGLERRLKRALREAGDLMGGC